MLTFGLNSYAGQDRVVPVTENRCNDMVNLQTDQGYINARLSNGEKITLYNDIANISCGKNHSGVWIETVVQAKDNAACNLGWACRAQPTFVIKPAPAFLDASPDHSAGY